jgi:hypothetical protein
MVLAAMNIATAFQQVHPKGYLIGDVKPENVLVTGQGQVTLVDNDSFQVTDGGCWSTACWEWSNDWFTNDIQRVTEETDPRGPDRGTRRLLGGGSWTEGPLNCRSAMTRIGDPSSANSFSGFRVAMDPP